MGKPRSVKGRALEVHRRLGDLFIGSAQELCALVHSNPFELLVATILSAQCTDERVNEVTSVLFGLIPNPESLAEMPRSQLEEVIYSTGFFRNKANSLQGMAQALVERHDGKVPASIDELTKLPGVGRKTANVVLSVAFGLPGLPVDTHVGRISRLVGLTENTDPERVEADLCALLPRSAWGTMSLRLILHGRATCVARRPKCSECVLADFCPSAFASGSR